MMRFGSTLMMIMMWMGSYALAAANQCVDTWKCGKASSAITLDADLSDWEAIEGITTELFSITQAMYKDGNATIKCLYDDDNIYLAMQVPGLYRFNATDEHQSAMIATMTKMGEKATFVDMGGCPQADAECKDSVPTSCEDYRVDIGAHWEVNDAEPSVSLPAGGTIPSSSQSSGSDTPVNKYDEYGVSPECRFPDDGENAKNDWRAAWTHTDPQDGAAGDYIFELSRPLSTASVTTDAQYAPGNVYQIGLAYWDPYETETGWTDSGHYVTGCASGWINLQLGDATTATADGGAAAGSGSGSGGGNGSGPSSSPGTTPDGSGAGKPTGNQKSRAVDSLVTTTLHSIATGIVVAMGMCI